MTDPDDLPECLPQRFPQRRRVTDKVLEDFFHACGGHPRLQVEASDGGGALERQRFVRPFLLVGRSADCDVQCPHPEVSYRHAYLQYLDGAVICLDLNSRTGTFGRWGRFEAARFGIDEVFSVGPYKVRLTEGDGLPIESGDPVSDGSASGIIVAGGQIARTDLAVRGDSAYPQVCLELEDGDGGPPLRHIVRRSVTLVGGWHGCDLRLKSRSVSRVHCSLVLTRHGLWAVDLLGRDGIQVNGQSVPYARLRDGCELQVGKFATTIRYEQPASASGGGRQEIQPRGGRRAKRRGRTGQVSEKLILSLVEHFASMQQQMYEQNQQQMTLMLQMFGSLHRSQQELIRDDLDRVHELMREMQQLQRMLLLRDSSSESAPPALEPPTPQPSTSQSPANKRLEAAPPKPAPTEPTPQDTTGTTAAAVPPVPSGPPPVPVHRPKPTASAEAANDNSDNSDESSGPLPSEPVASAEDDAANDAGSGHQAAPAAGENSVDERRPRASRDEANDHAWLLQRMQALENERHGRWKKIMRALGGG